MRSRNKLSVLMILTEKIKRVSRNYKQTQLKQTHVFMYQAPTSNARQLESPNIGAR